MAHDRFDPAKLDKLNDPARVNRMEPERIWAAAGVANPSVVVEIGAGSGVFARLFAGYAPGSTVYAVDSAPAMIDWMTRHRVPGVEGRLVPLLADGETIPLADGAADVVFMIDLHHELDVPGRIYAEAFRLLKGGGRIVVVDWVPDGAPGGPPQEARANAEEVGEALTRAGFGEVATLAGPSRHALVAATKPEGGNER